MKGLFCDWITLYQHHPEHAPLNSGCVVTFDKQGKAIFTRHRTARMLGSFETSVTVKSDGRTVVASGNFGRFGRKDNLFNYDPRETVAAVNRVLDYVGLPIFTVGGTFQEGIQVARGAAVSRIDLTRNYQSGSVANARAIIREISGRSVSRAKRGVAGDESVWWANTRYMLKFYIKALEMVANGAPESEVLDYCRDNGIFRAELELKRRELDKLELTDLGALLEAWDMGTLHKLFGEQTDILTKLDRSGESGFLDGLPKRLQVPASAWMKGVDLRAMMSRATFYRVRKGLLEYGIDISDHKTTAITARIREIEISPVEAPDWYWKQAA